MNYIYPAVFYPEEDGRYSVIFPDLNDLATYGDTLADDDKAVKKTLSIPAWLNTACENLGINFSKVLKDALIAKLQVQ